MVLLKLIHMILSNTLTHTRSSTSTPNADENHLHGGDIGARRGKRSRRRNALLHLWFLLLLLLLSPQLIMIESKIDLLIAMGEEEINAP